MKGDKQLLLERYKHAKTGKESMRYHAVLLIKTGSTVSKVARLFFVDKQTVRNWVEEWEKNKELKDKPRSGKPKTITKDIEKEICDLADENKPEDHGFNVSAWDCRELRIYLKYKHNIQVTDECIRRLLKRNKFNYRKLNYKFTKADESKRTEFLQDFRDLHQNLEDTTIIFQDEMSSKLHPNKGYIWTRENKPFIETECSHKKNYLISGVAPETGETYTTTNEKFNSKAFMVFLKHLLTSIPNEILLIMDNHPSHHSKMTAKFLEKHPRINILFTPKYSPDLNPAENFWNYLRKKFLNNKIFSTTEEMVEGVKRFIKNIPKEVIKSVCSYSYLLR